jgi:hypothetical protein
MMPEKSISIPYGLLNLAAVPSAVPEVGVGAPATKLTLLLEIFLI